MESLPAPLKKPLKELMAAVQRLHESGSFLGSKVQHYPNPQDRELFTEVKKSQPTKPGSKKVFDMKRTARTEDTDDLLPPDKEAKENE